LKPRSTKASEPGRQVALSADGKYLAMLSRAGFLRVWNVESQTLVALLPRLTPPYEKIDLAFSYNGR
jgi:WD40 repeat protein